MRLVFTAFIPVWWTNPLKVVSSMQLPTRVSSDVSVEGRSMLVIPTFWPRSSRTVIPPGRPNFFGGAHSPQTGVE